MQKQAVSSIDFWKERLSTAKKNGQLHYSVYLCNPTRWQEIEKTHAEILKKEIQPDMRVLDAGCGFGRMAKYFNPNKYVGIDLSPDLLVEAHKANPGYIFETENLKNIPFRDLYFDVAFCISIKQMIIGNIGPQEWLKIQTELKRVAKKVILLEYEEHPENYEVI